MSATPFGAGERTLLLLALVPFVVERGEATVAEAARHFEVPEQRIRDAVSLLTVTGVPGESRSYGPEDLFDIDWDAFEQQDLIVITHRVALEDGLRLTAKEASALIAGLQYLAALPEQGDPTAIGALLDKLSRGASGEVGQQLAVAVQGQEALRGELAVIRAALEAGRRLEFSYQRIQGEREVRQVDPIVLGAEQGVWYLTAWCHAREAVRTFLVERMAGLVVGAAEATHRAGAKAAGEEGFFAERELPEVVVEVAAGAVPLLRRHLADPLPGQAPAGWDRFTMRASHYHGLQRLVAGSGGLLRVIAPAEARQAAVDWAAAALARYRESAGSDPRPGPPG